MPRSGDLILDICKHPQRLASLSLGEWEQLLREARCLSLSARLAATVERLGLAERVPAPARRHLESDRIFAERHHKLMLWEIECLKKLLAATPGPLVFLKGAAYLLRGTRNAEGRLYNDLDLMAPLPQIPQVDATLRAGGWKSVDFSELEALYYRRWMNELPPFVHERRGTTLDLHHNLLARIDKLAIDPAPFFEAAVPLAPGSQFCTLSPPDMVLNNVVHQFRFGNFHKGLRDLIDLHDLLLDFGADAAFWPRLIERTEQLGFQTPCYFGLHFAQRYLGTPIPQEIRAAVAGWRPAWPPLALMERLVDRAIRPPLVGRNNFGREAANWILIRYPLCFWNKTVRPKLEYAAKLVGREAR